MYRCSFLKRHPFSQESDVAFSQSCFLQFSVLCMVISCSCYQPHDAPGYFFSSYCRYPWRQLLSSSWQTVCQPHVCADVWCSSGCADWGTKVMGTSLEREETGAHFLQQLPETCQYFTHGSLKVQWGEFVMTDHKMQGEANDLGSSVPE